MNNLKLTRGYMNNNPCNIIINPQLTFRNEIIPSKDKTFKQFTDIVWGYRAAIWLVKYYILEDNLNTIEKIINHCAPQTKNNTIQYIKNMEIFTGISRKTIIEPNNKDYIILIIKGISEQENGLIPDINKIKQAYTLL